MKKFVFLVSLLLITVYAYSQFEQKVNINFAIGSFKTFGKAMGEYDYDPLQMPHYRPGVMADAGLQVNINRRFSVMIYSGIMYSGSWGYKIGESDYLQYTLTDTLTDKLLAEGYNELNYFNFSIGIIPKYYFSPGKKWNPYFFAGVNFNFTHANYADNYWYDANEFNYLLPDDTGPSDPFLEKNIGFGFTPGLGIECKTGDKISFTFTTGYSLILLNKENFKSPYQFENFNAFFFQAGIRMSFIKSKDL